MMRAPRVLTGLLLLLTAAPLAGAYPSDRTSSAEEQAKRHFAEGRMHQHGQRWRMAIDAYEQSLKHNQDQAEAHNNLGFCYKSLGEFARAVTHYKDALRLNPDLAEAYEYLGEAYLGMGKIDLAKQQLRRLKQLDAGLAQELEAEIEEAATHAADHAP